MIFILKVYFIRRCRTLNSFIIFQQLENSMKTTHQLYTNKTSRQLFTLTQHLSNHHLHSKFIPVKQTHAPLSPEKQLAVLQCTSAFLEKQLDQAKQQQRMMIQLFESLSRVEQGQQAPSKKAKRRCKQDIIVRYRCPHTNCSRYYSSQDSLHRHAKMKHNCVKNQPPLLYRDLPPEPNLTTLREDTSQEEGCSQQSQAELESSRQNS